MYTLNQNILSISFVLIAFLNVCAMDDSIVCIKHTLSEKNRAAQTIARELANGNKEVIEKIVEWEKNQTHHDELKLIRGALIGQNLNRLTGALEPVYLGKHAYVSNFELSKNEAYLITQSWGKTLVWNTATHPFSLIQFPGKRCEITAAQFNNEHNFLFLGFEDGRILLFDLTQNSIHELKSHTSPVQAIVLSSNNKYIATYAQDTMRLWNIKNLNNPIDFLTTNSMGEFSNTHKYFACYIEGKLALVSLDSWNISKNTITILFSDVDADDGKARFSQGGNYLYLLAKSPEMGKQFLPVVGCWDLTSSDITSIPVPNKPLTFNLLPDCMKNPGKRSDHPDRPTSTHSPDVTLIYSPDGNCQLSIHEEELHVLYVATNEIAKIEMYDISPDLLSPVNRVEFSFNSNYIFVTFASGAMMVIDLTLKRFSIRELLEAIALPALIKFGRVSELPLADSEGILDFSCAIS